MQLYSSSVFVPVQRLTITMLGSITHLRALYNVFFFCLQIKIVSLTLVPFSHYLLVYTISFGRCASHEKENKNVYTHIAVAEIEWFKEGSCK